MSVMSRQCRWCLLTSLWSALPPFASGPSSLRLDSVNLRASFSNGFSSPEFGINMLSVLLLTANSQSVHAECARSDHFQIESIFCVKQIEFIIYHHVILYTKCLLLNHFLFSIVLTCAALKSYRIASIFGADNFTPSDLSDARLLRYFIVAVVVNMLLLTLYTILNFHNGGAYDRYKVCCASLFLEILGFCWGFGLRHFCPLLCFVAYS